MAYEYCRECCRELTVLDKTCPECGKRVGWHWTWDDRRLGTGQLIGLGMIFLSFAIELSDYGPSGPFSVTTWLIVAGILIGGLSPYRK